MHVRINGLGLALGSAMSTALVSFCGCAGNRYEQSTGEHAHNSCSIKRHQLCFELSGLIVEGRTQIFRESHEPTIKFGQHCSPKLLNVRFSKARHLADSLWCSEQIVNQEARHAQLPELL